MDPTHDRQPDGALEFVLKRFGDRKRQVELQFDRSETFRALCNDYLLCANAMERWQASDAPVAAQRADEYAESLTELEMEILDWLERERSASHGAQAVDA